MKPLAKTVRVVSCLLDKRLSRTGDCPWKGASAPSYVDSRGRPCETLYADGNSSHSFYNSQGQLWKDVDPDGVTTFYIYNAKGQQQYTIQALSSATAALSSYSALTTAFPGIRAGSDRITEIVTSAGAATIGSGKGTTRTGVRARSRTPAMARPRPPSTTRIRLSPRQPRPRAPASPPRRPPRPTTPRCEPGR
jgi:hypothetical protein